MKHWSLIAILIVASVGIFTLRYGFEEPKYPTRHNFMRACNYSLLNQVTPTSFFRNLITYRHHLKDRNILHKLFTDFPRLRTKLKAGDIVYCSCNDFSQYAEELIFKGKTPIIFVVKGDLTFPNEYDNEDKIEKILAHDNLGHIFVENNNYRGPSNKVSALPVGISHDKRYKFPRSRKRLDHDLDVILQHLQPTTERIVRPLCDFHFANSSQRYSEVLGEDRLKIAAKLQELGVCDFLPHRMPQLELWRQKGKRAFDISPVGNGFDCYRTWESLLLGCIVIVKTSFLDPLFEGLPVVVVKDWDEITEEKLHQWLNEYGDVFHDPEIRKKITHQYWMGKVLTRQKQLQSCNF